MSPPPIKKGWMKKLGRKGMIKNWKRRFFVLNAGVITYYEKELPDFPYGDSMKVRDTALLTDCFDADGIIFYRVSSIWPTRRLSKRIRSTMKSRSLLLASTESIIS
jgi:hypothetical protein